MGDMRHRHRGRHVSRGGGDRCPFAFGTGSAQPQMVVALGPLAFISMILLAGWLFRGPVARSRHPHFKPDLDREWLVRMSAILLKPAILWVLLALLTMSSILAGRDNPVGPGQLRFQAPGDPGWGALFASGGVLSGLAAALPARADDRHGLCAQVVSLELLIAVGVFAFIITACWPRLSRELAGLSCLGRLCDLGQILVEMTSAQHGVRRPCRCRGCPCDLGGRARQDRRRQSVSLNYFYRTGS